ncbi:MAG: hypothetical protein PHU75_08180 [Candidatus Nanopelagicales bacterium]|nr:hypothetical protein [Candidatus Nanopelagicales bacterium]
MAQHLLHRLFPSTDPQNWSAERWQRHLMHEATSAGERDEYNAIFTRA